jgi:hypothetical protein
LFLQSHAVVFNAENILCLPLLVAGNLYVLSTQQIPTISFGNGARDPWDMVPDDAVKLPLNLNYNVPFAGEYYYCARGVTATTLS